MRSSGSFNRKSLNKMEAVYESPVKFFWDSQDRTELKLLRQIYKLDEVVGGGKDDFEKIILLKKWVHDTLPLGKNPTNDYTDVTEILEDATSGKGEFFCSHYALVFIECATALGFKARKVGVDNDHEFGEEEMHHGVADIWDSVHGKWIVIDAMHNLHFEKDGSPLNALEVRNEYIQNGARDVEGVIGLNESRIKYSGVEVGFDTPSNYFWFLIYTDNGPNMKMSPVILFTDEDNEGKTWYRGGKHKGEFGLHPMYQGQFVKVIDSNIVFPNMEGVKH